MISKLTIYPTDKFILIYISSSRSIKIKCCLMCHTVTHTVAHTATGLSYVENKAARGTIAKSRMGSIRRLSHTDIKDWVHETMRLERAVTPVVA
jgi:hypothetical protein